MLPILVEMTGAMSVGLEWGQAASALFESGE